MLDWNLAVRRGTFLKTQNSNDRAAAAGASRALDMALTAASEGPQSMQIAFDAGNSTYLSLIHI